MTEPVQPEPITAKALNQLIAEGRQVCLIDTLGGDHYRQVHLPKARNACIFEVTFIEQMKAITADRGARIVLYGASARSRDARIAAQKLIRQGYSRIRVLQGGIEAWHNAGLPLEGDRAQPSGDPQTMIALEDRTFRIDTGRSTIQWTGRNPGTTHFGTIGIANGKITTSGGLLAATVTIDMNSITNINLEGDDLQPVLIDHLKSDDFFLTKLFPTAVLTITSGIPVETPYLSSPNYTMKGILELRGVKAELEFMATINKSAENELAAEAHFDVDRTRWGIIYGSTRFFEHLGMHMVFDVISLQVRLVAV